MIRVWRHLLIWLMDQTERRHYEVWSPLDNTAPVDCCRENTSYGLRRKGYRLVRTPAKNCPRCKGEPSTYWRNRLPGRLEGARALHDWFDSLRQRFHRPVRSHENAEYPVMIDPTTITPETTATIEPTPPPPPANRQQRRATIRRTEWNSALMRELTPVVPRRYRRKTWRRWCREVWLGIAPMEMTA